MKSFQQKQTRRQVERKRLSMSSRFHIKFFKRFEIVLVAIALALASADVQAQRKKKKTTSAPQATLVDRVVKAKQDVIRAAKEYKASLEKVLAFQEEDVKTATETVERRKILIQQGIVSKKEVEESERLLAGAQAKVAETRKQMGEADNLVAEAAAEEKLARMPPARVGSYQTTAALIRFNGPSRWVLADSAKVESFFKAQFHRSIPISAFGQTAVHNQLGFDHSNSIDVALHPDSVEGQALMAYLRSAGIPFIAFRQAIAGSATGAHIHIGYPSHRIR